jgi:phage-related holin
MENIFKYLWGAATGIVALLLPAKGLILCALAFVAIDFATGVAASHSLARRENTPWSFSSRRAWDTILKSVFVMAGIILAWLLDSIVITFVQLHLAKIFTGFVCGIEFWSYLENAAEISGQPLFRTLRDALKKRFDKFFDSF